MHNVMQQVLNYFEDVQNMEIKFRAHASGFTASVSNSRIVYRSEDVESISVVWEDNGNFNMFSITVTMGELEMSDQTRQLVNAFNLVSYGWKAVVGNGTPYLSFVCEYEFVQPDKVFQILSMAFGDLCGEDNELEFYDLISKQLKKQ